MRCAARACMFRSSMSSMTAEERRKLGHARRKKVGRHELGAFNAKARKSAPLALLEHSMRGRVPALIALKYEMMGASPFAYFRGAAPGVATAARPAPNRFRRGDRCY